MPNLPKLCVCGTATCSRKPFSSLCYRNGKNLLTLGNRSMQSAVLCVSSLQPGREQVHRIERALKATMRVVRETNVLIHRLGQIKFVSGLDGTSTALVS